MKQKRVSFRVAKALKEAGYPQECGLWFSSDGREFSYTEDYSNCYARPTYLEAWLWIEQETDILIDSECIRSDTFAGYRYMVQYPSGCVHTKYKYDCSPYCYKTREEAIIAAIEYLVENNLLK